jgi:thiol-disulfide isomerase/thioredoxin
MRTSVFFLIFLLIVSESVIAKTVISGSFPVKDSKKYYIRVFRIWNLLMESETREILGADSTDKNGRFKIVFDLARDEILILDGAGFKMNLFIKKDDSLFVKVKSPDEILFSGKRSYRYNNILFKDKLLLKDNYLDNSDFSDSMLIYNVIDSIQKLYLIKSGNKNIDIKNFNNYKNAELIGKQILIMDYIERNNSLSGDLKLKIDSLWKQLPILESFAEKSRAYVNSCLFLSDRTNSNAYLEKNNLVTNKFIQYQKSLLLKDSLFRKNKQLLKIFINAGIRSLAYLAQNTEQLNNVIYLKNKYKIYIGDKYSLDAIARQITKKKIELKIIYGANFSVINYDDDSLNLYQIKGEFIILDFWATWCKPCIEEIIDFKESPTKFKRDVRIIFINIDDNHKKWKDFLIKHNLSESFFFATKEESALIKKNYGFFELPHKVLLDSSLKIIASGKENVNNYLIKYLIK